MILSAMSDKPRYWAAVSAAFLLNGALLGIWASRIPYISERLSLSEGQLAIPLLMLALGAVVAFQIAGKVADQIGAKRTTAALSILYTLALLPLAMAPNALSLGGALFIFGATHGAMDVAMNVWATQVDEKLKTNYMPSFHALFSVGLGLGGASGAIASAISMPPLPHFAIAGFGLLILCFVFSVDPWAEQNTAASPADDQPTFSVPRGALVLVGLFAACAAIGEGAMVDWSAIFLNREMALAESTAAMALVAFNIGMVSIRLAGSVLMKRFSRLLIARTSGLTACVGIILLVASAQMTLGLFPALAGLIMIGMGLALVFPMAFSRAAEEPNGKAGQNIAAVATVGYGGLLVGPVLIGLLAEVITLQWAVLCLAVTSIMIAILAGHLRRR